MSELNQELIQEFFNLVKSDDVFALTTMINNEPALANARNEHGVPAVLVAIYYDRKDVINLLLASGAKVDLFIAAALGNVPKIEKALAADAASIAAYSTDGWTALHLAAFFGRKEAAAFLLNAGANVLARSTNAMNNHPMHAAAAGRRRDIVAMLIEKGADINATQAGGWTPLHAAAQNGDLEMAKVLLANGANAGIRADNGQLPLDLAMTNGSQPIVDLLMEAPGVQ
ncbi:MAG: ankyrin repeat domain-containing protein [Bryobacterales bacterium]|nr:ankyrin repeat domain-containing protein [Bryobacterales bacterium]